MPLRPLMTLALLASQPLAAGEETAEKALGILDRRCFECHSHSAGKNKGGLVMDAPQGLSVGGESGAALVAGKPEDSLFIERILSTDKDEMMPPKGERLTEEEVSTVKAWVAAGAKWPASRATRATSAKYLPGRINDEDRAWWAYRPVVRAEIPAPALPSTGPNPVDRFIDRRLAKEGLTPAPEAARAALVRRVTFDVTGLPPSPEEVEAFVKDASPDAYERLVDRLLASRGFAERNARVWLDLVRYADSDGYRADDYRPTAWRYRDYVIRSLHSNKPYDRFLQEQVAGDELFPGDPDALTGTGFLHHWIYEYNLRDARGQWTTILNDVTDTVGDALLGAGMQCARCHDHKFDPILQRDYFALRAFFSNILPVEDRAAWTKEESEAHARRLADWEKKTAATREEIAKIEQPYREKATAKSVAMFPEDIQAMINKPAAERTPIEAQLAALAWRQVDYEFARLDRVIKGENRTRLDELRKKLAELDAEKPADPPYVLSIREPARSASPVTIPKKTSAIEPAFLSVLSPAVPAAPAVIPPAPEGVESSGRRSVFARWLTRPENPFTARLAMNRLWQQYFRRGLTPHASDFGRLGEPPSHPELLDWLASEFVRLGWDVKAMHRLVLTSAAYRRSSEHPDPAAGRTKDPLNVLVWRFQPQRLEAEQIRDALFAACGDLDDRKQGGEGVLFSAPVRSIYTRAIRNNRDPLMDVFDAPEWFNSSSSRPVTTTPIQSLLLLTSPVMI
ncbi:MAG: PSD1 and planctomycete cytochrome C domain-containing protein [Opitutales bacterium]